MRTRARVSLVLGSVLLLLPLLGCAGAPPATYSPTSTGSTDAATSTLPVGTEPWTPESTTLPPVTPGVGASGSHVTVRGWLTGAPGPGGAFFGTVMNLSPRSSFSSLMGTPIARVGGRVPLDTANALSVVSTGWPSLVEIAAPRPTDSVPATDVPTITPSTVRVLWSLPARTSDTPTDAAPVFLSTGDFVVLRGWLWHMSKSGDRLLPASELGGVWVLADAPPTASRVARIVQVSVDPAYRDSVRFGNDGMVQVVGWVLPNAYSPFGVPVIDAAYIRPY